MKKGRDKRKLYKSLLNFMRKTMPYFKRAKSVNNFK